MLLACSSASAQTVYRCGNSYSQAPCGTDARAIQTDDPRTDAQRMAAQQGLARDKALAREMEASRRKDEAQAMANIKSEQAALTRKAAADKKSEDKKSREAKASAKSKKAGGLRTVQVQEPDVFTAAGPAAPKRAKTPSKGSAP